MNNRILVVLGSKNSEKGILVGVAKSRLNLCWDTYKPNDLVVCTGGWGANFNTTKQPHAFYAKRYLLEKGISPSSFLDFALSKNTVEDAVKTREIVADYKDYELVIVTSDFHVERVELIFKIVLKEYNLRFLGAKSVMTKKTMEALIDHERQGIESILTNGLYFNGRDACLEICF